MVFLEKSIKKYAKSDYYWMIWLDVLGILLWTTSFISNIISFILDKTSTCDCFYQPEGSAIKLYIPEWTSYGKEKHTVFSLLDNFYKGISSEKTKTDISHVLFLSELTKQGWPWVKFLKVFLCALNNNGVSSPVTILESKRDIFETVSEIVQQYAIHASELMYI